MRISREKLKIMRGGRYVDIYDYKVKECICKGEEMIIDVFDHKLNVNYGRMILTPWEVRNKQVIITDKVFPSNYKPYKLISYLWKPMTEEEEAKYFLL